MSRRGERSRFLRLREVNTGRFAEWPNAITFVHSSDGEVILVALLELSECARHGEWQSLHVTNLKESKQN